MWQRVTISLTEGRGEGRAGKPEDFLACRHHAQNLRPQAEQVSAKQPSKSMKAWPHGPCSVRTSSYHISR